MISFFSLLFFAFDFDERDLFVHRFVNSEGVHISFFSFSKPPPPNPPSDFFLVFICLIKFG